MNVTTLEQVALEARDVEVALRLYRDVLGLQETPAEEPGESALAVGETLLNICHVRGGPAAREGIAYLTFGAPDAAAGVGLTWVDPGTVQGLRAAVRPPSARAPAAPGMVLGIDHVVVSSGDSAATAAAVHDALGLEIRRTMSRPGTGAHLEFAKISGVVIEFAGPPEPKPPPVTATYWGLVFAVQDIAEATHALRASGYERSEPRDAVQPGALIATVKGYTGGVPLALIQYGAR